MLVPQKNVTSNRKRFVLLKFFANLTITSMILFVITADLIALIYQHIYFTIAEIPKIKRSAYIKMTRHRLPGLAPIQKWCCWYCEYTNNVIAWIKAIANQTEIYSCAIKYTTQYSGQEYQEEFYNQEEFIEKK